MLVGHVCLISWEEKREGDEKIRDKKEIGLLEGNKEDGKTESMAPGILWVSSRIVNPDKLEVEKFCDWYENVCFVLFVFFLVLLLLLPHRDTSSSLFPSPRSFFTLPRSVGTTNISGPRCLFKRSNLSATCVDSTYETTH